MNERILLKTYLSSSRSRCSANGKKLVFLVSFSWPCRWPESIGVNCLWLTLLAGSVKGVIWVLCRGSLHLVGSWFTYWIGVAGLSENIAGRKWSACNAWFLRMYQRESQNFTYLFELGFRWKKNISEWQNINFLYNSSPLITLWILTSVILNLWKQLESYA